MENLIPVFTFFPNFHFIAQIPDFTSLILVFLGISFNQSKSFLKKKRIPRRKRHFQAPKNGKRDWKKGQRGHGGVVRVPNPTNAEKQALEQEFKIPGAVQALGY